MSPSSKSSADSTTLSTDPLSLLAELVAAPGPPGQERQVRETITEWLSERGLSWRVDAAGNLLAGAGSSVPETPKIVVAAHMDEIALIVTEVHPDGSLDVSPLGGAFVWKWGEGPVEVWPIDGAEPIHGVLSLGGIHTTHPSSTIQKVREGHAPTWDDARVCTYQPANKLPPGILAGARVTVARERRTLWRVGADDELVASYFLDDRADIIAWLLALETLAKSGDGRDILFAATVSEEVGGQGALWLLGNLRPEICVALEIGPSTPDNPLALDASPVCWVHDGYASTAPSDLALVQSAGHDCGQTLRFMALTRGGSDASCAAAMGQVARPITLAFAADNSHGFEVMHKDAITALADLTVATLRRL